MSEHRPATWGSGKRSVRAGANATAKPAPEPTTPSGPAATDAARELANELGVDLERVTGTGKDGNITIKDVHAAADQAVGT